ncbi:MAG: H-X9-DG-CTERM domain-containing protein [Gemmataceae bacterium]
MPGSVSNPCDMLHFWGLHPGRANLALADGSARFIGHEAHPVMPALVTRAGQEARTDPDGSSWPSAVGARPR